MRVRARGVRHRACRVVVDVVTTLARLARDVVIGVAGGLVAIVVLVLAFVGALALGYLLGPLVGRLLDWWFG